MTPMPRGIFSLEGLWLEAHTGNWKGFQITREKSGEVILKEKVMDFTSREIELSLESSMDHGPVEFKLPYEFWE